MTAVDLPTWTSATVVESNSIAEAGGVGTFNRVESGRMVLVMTGRATSEWVATFAIALNLGDALVAGRIVDKAWGGPIGLEAWRFVLDTSPTPYWLPSDATVVCRRAHIPHTSRVIPGILVTDPTRDDDRLDGRAATLAWARRELERARRGR